MQRTGALKASFVAALSLLLPALGGCQAIAWPWLMWGPEPTKTIAAEFPYLSDKRICILVHADMETLFEYPKVQWEVASHVGVVLEANVKSASVVDPEQVFDYQNRTPDWERIDPAAIGKQFQADRVLEIILTQYTTREPASEHLYRGHITADVRIYNTEYPDSKPAYEKEVKTVYPPESAGQYGSDDRGIRAATMQAFALDVGGKFFDRKVKVK